MRKIAFGYSTRCNIKCGHCVADGEPFIYFDDIAVGTRTIPQLSQDPFPRF